MNPCQEFQSYVFRLVVIETEVGTESTALPGLLRLASETLFPLQTDSGLQTQVLWLPDPAFISFQLCNLAEQCFQSLWTVPHL